MMGLEVRAMKRSSGDQAIQSMSCPNQINDQDRPFYLPVLLRCPGMSEFLLHATMWPIMLAGMGFSSINKQKGNTLWSRVTFPYPSPQNRLWLFKLTPCLR